MHISKINSATINHATKPRRGIRGFIKEMQHNHRSKQMAECDAKMASINAAYIQGNPDIAAKVNAVTAYVMKPDFTSPKISDDTERHKIFYSKEITYKDLIGRCTSIDEIYNKYGSYGLKVYAGLLNDDVKNKLLPKSSDYKISECMCDADRSAVITFNEYLMSNDKGYPSDIYQRFGQFGKNMLDSYMVSGYVGNGLSGECKGSYHTTSYFNTMIRDSYETDVLLYEKF